MSQPSGDTLLMTLPVRGLHLIDTTALDDLFERPWAVVGHLQFNELENRFGSSFQSNLRKTRERAWPSAVFFYRYHHPTLHVSEAARKAEVALGALSMAVMLHPWPGASPDGPVANPRPIFRSRYSEYFDTPLALGRDGVKVVGGGRSVFSLLRPDWIAPERSIDHEGLRTVVDSAPDVIPRVLDQVRLQGRERRLAAGMTVINSAFQTLSAGAFVSSLVSASEVLVDAQAGSDGEEFRSSWDRRKARIRAALGDGCDEVLNRVVKARHDFVHAGQQPADDTLPFAALGIAVQVWSVIAELYGRGVPAQDAEKLLDAASIAARATPAAPTPLRALVAEIPSGARAALPWIDFWFGKATDS